MKKINIFFFPSNLLILNKLVLRPADNYKGRMIKLSRWIDLERKYKGVKFPNDLEKFVSLESDILINFKNEIKENLKEKGWEPKEIVDPTLLKRLCREA